MGSRSEEDNPHTSKCRMCGAPILPRIGILYNPKRVIEMDEQNQ
jgi:hypothetical protein